MSLMELKSQCWQELYPFWGLQRSILFMVFSASRSFPQSWLVVTVYLQEQKSHHCSLSFCRHISFSDSPASLSLSLTYKDTRNFTGSTWTIQKNVLISMSLTMSSRSHFPSKAMYSESPKTRTQTSLRGCYSATSFIPFPHFLSIHLFQLVPFSPAF